MTQKPENGETQIYTRTPCTRTRGHPQTRIHSRSNRRTVTRHTNPGRRSTRTTQTQKRSQTRTHKSTQTEVQGQNGGGGTTCTLSLDGPATYYLLPTTHYLLPLPTTYYLLPTTYYPLPTTHYLLPTTYYQNPTSNPTPEHYPDLPHLTVPVLPSPRHAAQKPHAGTLPTPK
jgi:hypothetical protein